MCSIQRNYEVHKAYQTSAADLILSYHNEGVLFPWMVTYRLAKIFTLLTMTWHLFWYRRDFNSLIALLPVPR